MLVRRATSPAASNTPATPSSSGRSVPVIGSDPVGVVTVLDVTVGVAGTGEVV